MEKLTPTQEKLVREIASKYGLNNFDTAVKPGGERGDNYLSVTKIVDLQDQSSGKTLNLFMKCALTSAQLREQLAIGEIFQREISCYEQMFPKFRHLYTTKHATYAFPTFATFYGGTEEPFSETVVLGNLKLEGYRLWERIQPMDEQHIATVLQEYGKVPAFSLAISDQTPRDFDNLKDRFSNLFLEKAFTVGAKAANRKKFDEVIDLLNDIRFTVPLNKFEEEFEGFVQELEKEQTVFIHGDCWCNNILFKYEDEENPGIPTKVCFIDWQMSRMASPVLDLSYFLCACAPKAILDDYERYLGIYYDSLSRMMKELGSDPNTVFPYSELQKHWEKYCKFGLYMAMMIIKMMVSESAEAPDLGEVADSGKNFMQALQFETIHNDEYRRRISDVISFMVDNSFI